MRWVVVSFIIIWIVLLWAVVAYALWRGWAPYVCNKRLPKSRVFATVKRKLEGHDYNVFEQDVETVQKVLVFECDDGVDRDYSVHDSLYDWVEIGDDGDLIYQGEHFVDFEPRRPRVDPEELYKQLTR